MPPAGKQPTGGDHQKPYPHLLHEHVQRAIDAHLDLTVPPEPDDTDGEATDEGSSYE